VSQRKIPESKTELYSTFAGREFSQREWEPWRAEDELEMTLDLLWAS
jgi:hypothetical protein